MTLAFALTSTRRSILSSSSLSLSLSSRRTAGPAAFHHHSSSSLLPLQGPTDVGYGRRGGGVRRQSTHDNDASSSSSSLLQEREDLWQENCKMQLAPMMDYTDRHFRYMVRLLSRRTLLYTEMVAANALAHEAPPQEEEADNADNAEWSYLRRVLLGQASRGEGPCVLQLGGSHPETLRDACRVVRRAMSQGICNYTALNLNCGCPSPRVAQKGCFGAALMEEEPQRVREMLLAMAEGSNGEMPLSVKCRIGTDLDWGAVATATAAGTNDGRSRSTRSTRRSSSKSKSALADYTEEDYQRLCRFIDVLSQDGLCRKFQIHARIAVLAPHWSPADNRKIPPLHHNVVLDRLVSDFGHLDFCLNGGIDSLQEAQKLLLLDPQLQGVMIGRAWAAQPWSFAMTDAVLYNDHHDDDDNHKDKDNAKNAAVPHRWHVLQEYGKHADAEEEMWGPQKCRRFLVKAIMPLFAGEANNKAYRIALDELATSLKRQDAASSKQPLSELILQVARQHLDEQVLFESPRESWEKQLERQEAAAATTPSIVVNAWQAPQRREAEKEKEKENQQGEEGKDDTTHKEEEEEEEEEASLQQQTM